MLRFSSSLVVCAFLGLLIVPSSVRAGPSELAVDVSRFRIIERESGPINYYTVIKDPKLPYIRSMYRSPYETSVLGYQLPDEDRKRARKLRWSWRAITLPNGGNECVKGKGDSAAVIYVSWRRGLRWYTLKYAWSAVGPKGATCASKRNPFVAQDTVILQSGGPLMTWKTEEIDLKSEFRKHFADGDPNADVPELLGIGLMSDGDQTKSISSADYASFAITR